MCIKKRRQYTEKNKETFEMKSSRLEVRLAKNMQRKLMHLVQTRFYLISFDIEHVDITDKCT